MFRQLLVLFPKEQQQSKQTVARWPTEKSSLHFYV